MRQQRPRAKVPIAKTVSLRKDVSDSMGSFLKRERILGKETTDGLISLVSLLSHYKEEGQQLFPEIFVFDDVVGILRSLPNSERVVIGVGPKASDTLSVALKRCAPLAQWGWSIYVLRIKNGFEYGLLRCGLTALSLSASELLVNQGRETLPAILVRHVSQNTIEILGGRGNSLRIHFGAVEAPEEDPVEVTRKFCVSVARNVPSGLQEQLQNFYRRLLAGVLRSGHGCLAAVLNRRKAEIPRKLRDGVILKPAVDVAAKVSSLLKGTDCESDTRLRAAAALIRGMLLSDGITVFGSDGSVRAYNVFVRMVREKSGGQSAKLGGARRRAFEILCSWVGGHLVSAFFLSQDGHAEFRGE